MNPSKWIRLNPANLNVARAESISGLDAKVFLSPYDVPHAVRSFTDPSRHCMGIEFTYMDSDEPKVSLPARNNIVFVLGKNSHRLFSLCVPTESAERQEQIYASLKAAIGMLEGEPVTQSPRLENYELAKKVIDQVKADLLPAVAVARQGA